MICPYPTSIVNPLADADGFLRMHVGCGKCGACKSNRRSDWSFRIQQEAKVSDSCYFITLTYHDSRLPMTENWLPSVDKEDVQLFNKALRNEQFKITERKFRYFCVGEYGTKFHRPHYHLIYFNLHPKLAEPELLLPIWEHGIVHKLGLDKGLTHYATKYHVTAQKRERALNTLDDRKDEFTIASNKPPDGGKYGGIGYQYIDKTKRYHLDSKNAYITNNGFKQRMPNYYYRHIFAELEDSDKEKMRKEAETLIRKVEDKEMNRLRKLGYKYPEQEFLRRLVAESKNVVFKANQKGIF